MTTTTLNAILSTLAITLRLLSATLDAQTLQQIIPSHEITIVGSVSSSPVALYSSNSALIRAIWGEDASDAIRIAECESGLKNEAINFSDIKLNGHPSIGLFQISRLHGHSTSTLLDPYENTIIAKELYDKSGGFSPWKNCARILGI